MINDIELDDIQVVDVTGKAYRDKKARSKRGRCNCNPSLRATTILIFICIGIVYIIGVGIGIILMFDSLEHLDTESSNTTVNRLAMMLRGDMGKLRQFALMGAYSVNVLDVLRNYRRYQNGEITKEQMDGYFTEYESSSVNTSGSFSCGGQNNYVAFLDPDFNTLWSVYYPGNGTSLCSGWAPSPTISPDTYKAMRDSESDTKGWVRLAIPDEGDSRPLALGVAQVVDGSDVYGYLVNGRNILPRLNNDGNYVDDVPTCITMENGYEDGKKWDAEDQKAFDKVIPGTFAADTTYAGLAAFAKRDNEIIQATSGRVCPSVPLFNATDTLMVGYMKLCGVDPKKFGEHSCIKFRVDRPMSMVEEGTTPVVSLSLEVIAMMVLLCIIFVIFLDCVVLRRIENLSNVIRSQTRGHAKALEDEDEATATISVAEDKHTEKHGKSGRSSKIKSGRSASGTSETSDSSATTATNASGATKGPATAHDEIGNLKRAMEQNAIGLRKRLEAVNDSIKIEQQKTIHHKQAMQLLNLWCGRKDFFPGLRPNAMQLRYEPTRNLDDLLSNPLAIEYLKSHCESDRTLENLWFLLDVSWMEELETAEDNEESPEKRAQIHDVVVSAARTIVKRYIALNAPQEINLSAGTFKKLREVGERYSRKMFDEAVGEVKLMLNTDILPRFQKTSAYSAMSETLYIDSSGGGDESSEFSDETVSTAGSILTDEGEEAEGGVARIFAQTFKNLHTTFDVGQHDDNSSSYSANSSSRVAAGPTGSVVPDSQTETTTAHGAEERGTVQTSTKDDEESEREPPKLTDDEKEEEKPQKSAESSDSSSHSLSSDSVSESSSSSTAGISDASE